MQVCPEQAEVHILENEAASRAYLQQVWAEAMTIYRAGGWKLTFSPEMVRYLKEHQKDFMPEDTKAGMIQAFLDSYAGDTVCSKQLYKEALNHAFDEPKQWEIREINEIMNQCRVRQTKGLGACKGCNEQGQPLRRNPGRLCGDHGADRDAVLKGTAGCKPCCCAVAGLVAREIPVLSGFFYL